jgi:hypothetical protein
MENPGRVRKGCNEWEMFFFIHLNRLERKPGNKRKSEQETLHICKENFPPCKMDAWPISYLTKGPPEGLGFRV